MKKFVLLIAFLFMLCCSSAFSVVQVSYTDVLDNDGSNTIEVANGTTFYTREIDISKKELLSLEVYDVDNDGASVDVDIYIEFGYAVSDNDGYADTGYTVPNSNGTVCNGSSSDPIDAPDESHIYDLYDKGLNYCRFKIDENGNGVTLKMRIWHKEEY